MRVKLTDRFVKSAALNGRKSPIFMDDEVIGFGVQVRETGRKSFTLDYSFEGRRRRLFIGDFPDWSTVAARDYAKQKKREVDQGIDPLAVRDERRTAPTMNRQRTLNLRQSHSRNYAGIKPPRQNAKESILLSACNPP